MLGHTLRTYKDSAVPANSYKTMPEIMDASFDVHKCLKTTCIPQGPITEMLYWSIMYYKHSINTVQQAHQVYIPWRSRWPRWHSVVWWTEGPVAWAGGSGSEGGSCADAQTSGTACCHRLQGNCRVGRKRMHALCVHYTATAACSLLV